jgi:hypothetical protein
MDCSVTRQHSHIITAMGTYENSVRSDCADSPTCSNYLGRAPRQRTRGCRVDSLRTQQRVLLRLGRVEHSQTYLGVVDPPCRPVDVCFRH